MPWLRLPSTCNVSEFKEASWCLCVHPCMPLSHYVSILCNGAPKPPDAVWLQPSCACRFDCTSGMTVRAESISPGRWISLQKRAHTSTYQLMAAAYEVSKPLTEKYKALVQGYTVLDVKKGDELSSTVAALFHAETELSCFKVRVYSNILIMRATIIRTLLLNGQICCGRNTTIEICSYTTVLHPKRITDPRYLDAR